jgi:DNA-binding PadR family transcriptional regulator
MSLKYMILGCLTEAPIHGYDMLRVIFRDFAEQGPEVNSGQLYTLLNRLEAEGLVEREVVQQEKAPNRKLITITPRGREEFYEWLRSDAAERGYIRYDFFHRYGFLYKVNHFKKMRREERLAKVDQQLAQMEEKLANLMGALDDMIRRKNDPYRILILEYGIEAQKTKIRWLRRLREAVVSGGPEAAPPGSD